MITDEFRESFGPIIEALKKKHCQLGLVDLVVEGGVGMGREVGQFIKEVFPKALYVGTDLSSNLFGNQPRLQRQIDAKSLIQIEKANKKDPVDLEGAIIRANCFDSSLIQDIVLKTHRKKPLLVSYNATGSLNDRKLNFWESKDDQDQLPVSAWFATSSPFVGQVHLTHLPTGWNEGDFLFKRSWEEIARQAEKEGYEVDRLDYGLAAIRR